MTYAPASLRLLGSYWTDQGGVNLGVVGDANHTAGYHLGKDRIYAPSGLGGADYSVQLERDKRGLSDAAAAIDLGRMEGSLQLLYKFSRWLVQRCQEGADGTRDVREIIYSPDGKQVQRYSGVDQQIHTGPGNGDLSHVSHTHISWFRDSQDRDKIGVFAPYFEGDDMGLAGGPIDPGQGIGTVTIKPERGVVNLLTGKAGDPAQDVRQSFGRWRLAEPYGVGEARQVGYLVSVRSQAHIALDDVVESFVPAAPPQPGTPTTYKLELDGTVVAEGTAP